MAQHLHTDSEKEFKMLKTVRLCLWGAMAALSTLAPSVASAEEVGVSRADLPSYSGEFSIENATQTTIHYQYRWGDKEAWRTSTLARGRVDVHSCALGADPHKRIPAPYVRFGRHEYEMDFFAVGYAGYGPKQNKAQPKRYVFRVAANGRDLVLRAK